MKPLPRKMSYLCESLFDITNLATWMICAGSIEVDDSRELFQTCLELARKFEAENPCIGDEYMDKIGLYAEEKLVERYGRKEE